MPRHTDRRTVLKSIPATAIGGSIIPEVTRAGRSDVRNAEHDDRNEIEVVAEHDEEEDEHRLELSTNEIASGWTTITFDNRTDHTHFYKWFEIPQAALDAAEEADEDVFDFYYEHFTRPFQYFMDDVAPDKEPDPDDLSDRYSDPENGNLYPPWVMDVRPSGGVGLTSGHRTSITTLELEPGTYFTECYVKDDDEEFHSYNGMADVVTVTDARDGEEPDATVEVSLSTVETGEDEELRSSMEVNDSIQAGQHTIAVRFEDQQLFQNLSGHDAHMLRLDADTTLDDVSDWMNWMEPGQFVSDGTGPGTFLGGVHDIFTPEQVASAQSEGDESGDTDGAGDESNGENSHGAVETAYFEVTLNPGAYALVSEVPDPEKKGLLEPFIVPFDRADDHEDVAVTV